MLQQERKLLKRCPVSGFADEIDISVDKQIAVLKRLGISWVEFRSGDGINVGDYTLEQARLVKEKLSQNGIGVSAIASLIGKIGIEEELEPHLKKLEHIADIAHVMECRYIRMFSFFLPDGANPEEYRDAVMKRMQAMMEIAQKRGIVLLHENEKGIYGDAVQRCLELMQKFAGPNFGCTFDFANFVQCGQNTWEAYEKLKPYISYVHIKDAVAQQDEVVLPGEGEGQLPRILKQLDEDGYDGFLSMEPHLVDFAGFSMLERGTKKMKSGDGEEAFQSAYEALEKILC